MYKGLLILFVAAASVLAPLRAGASCHGWWQPRWSEVVPSAPQVFVRAPNCTGMALSTISRDALADRQACSRVDRKHSTTLAQLAPGAEQSEHRTRQQHKAGGFCCV